MRHKRKTLFGLLFVMLVALICAVTIVPVSASSVTSDWYSADGETKISGKKQVLTDVADGTVIARVDFSGFDLTKGVYLQLDLPDAQDGSVNFNASTYIRFFGNNDELFFSLGAGPAGKLQFDMHGAGTVDVPKSNSYIFLLNKNSEGKLELHYGDYVVTGRDPVGNATHFFAKVGGNNVSLSAVFHPLTAERPEARWVNGQCEEITGKEQHFTRTETSQPNTVSVGSIATEDLDFATGVWFSLFAGNVGVSNFGPSSGIQLKANGNVIFSIGNGAANESYVEPAGSSAFKFPKANYYTFGIRSIEGGTEISYGGKSAVTNVSISDALSLEVVAYLYHDTQSDVTVKLFPLAPMCGDWTDIQTGERIEGIKTFTRETESDADRMTYAVIDLRNADLEKGVYLKFDLSIVNNTGVSLFYGGDRLFDFAPGGNANLKINATELSAGKDGEFEVLFRVVDDASETGIKRAEILAEGNSIRNGLVNATGLDSLSVQWQITEPGQEVKVGLFAPEAAVPLSVNEALQQVSVEKVAFHSYDTAGSRFIVDVQFDQAISRNAEVPYRTLPNRSMLVNGKDAGFAYLANSSDDYTANTFASGFDAEKSLRFYFGGENLKKITFLPGMKIRGTNLEIKTEQNFELPTALGTDATGEKIFLTAEEFAVVTAFNAIIEESDLTAALEEMGADLTVYETFTQKPSLASMLDTEFQSVAEIKTAFEEIVADAVNAALESFTLTGADSFTANEIELPETLNGLAVIWTSDSDVVNIETGKVTRPAFGENDAAVTLTVCFGEVERKIALTVKAVAVSSIEVTAPTKLDYEIGDELDLAGGKVKVYYDNGTDRMFDMTASMLSGVDLSKAGTVTVTVTYEGKSATFAVTVTAPEVTRIEVTAPTKRDYKVGDELDLAGGKVKVYYDNGTDQTIDLADSMISGADLSKSGTVTVTVTYEGKTATFEIEVTAEKKGCGSVNSSGMWIFPSLLGLLGAALFAVRRKDQRE